jgi:geranylgeranyl diphosphate synthase, type I
VSKHKDLNYDELALAIAERGQKTLERFGKTIFIGVSNPTLISILKEVKEYWRDFSRPALTSLSCEAVGGKLEMANDAGLIFTLASAGIGIHDDIIDKSSNKHFRMTIPGLHSPEEALLVGDLLVLKAWTIFQEMIRKASNPLKIADIMEVYGNLSFEICETELMEISCRHNLDTDLDYCKMILWKSMADTEACTKIGAMLGGGSENEVQALAEFGRRLGFMQRLLDDVKDSLNIEGNLPHRLEHETIPLPILYAATSSKENCLKIKSVLKNSPITPSNTKALLKICIENEAFAYVQEIAKQNESEAVSKLSLLKPSNARNILKSMMKKSFSNVDDLCL